MMCYETGCSIQGTQSSKALPTLDSDKALGEGSRAVSVSWREARCL